MLYISASSAKLLHCHYLQTARSSIYFLQSFPIPKPVITKTKESVYRIFNTEKNFRAEVGYLAINISAHVNFNCIKSLTAQH